LHFSNFLAGRFFIAIICENRAQPSEDLRPDSQRMLHKLNVMRPTGIGSIFRNRAKWDCMACISMS